MDAVLHPLCNTDAVNNPVQYGCRVTHLVQYGCRKHPMHDMDAAYIFCVTIFVRYAYMYMASAATCITHKKSYIS